MEEIIAIVVLPALAAVVQFGVLRLLGWLSGAAATDGFRVGAVA